VPACAHGQRILVAFDRDAGIRCLRGQVLVGHATWEVLAFVMIGDGKWPGIVAIV